MKAFTYVREEQNEASIAHLIEHASPTDRFKMISR